MRSNMADALFVVASILEVNQPKRNTRYSRLANNIFLHYPFFEKIRAA